MKRFLIIIYFLMLIFSGVFAVLSGVLLTDAVASLDVKGVAIYGAGSLFLGILGASGISKTNEKITFWYLFMTFTLAGFVGGMSRYFIPHNDGLMFIVITLIFLAFFIVGRGINKKAVESKKTRTVTI